MSEERAVYDFDRERLHDTLLSGISREEYTVEVIREAEAASPEARGAMLLGAMHHLGIARKPSVELCYVCGMHIRRETGIRHVAGKSERHYHPSCWERQMVSLRGAVGR